MTGAILCGGMSTRMGTPKHAIVLEDGRTMIEHVIDALRGACDRIVLLDSATKAQGLQSPGFDGNTIVDLRAGMGPLGGIEALLASGIDDDYIVCPCDLPRVTEDVFGALLAETAARSTALQIEGREEPCPLPARISAAALPVVREMLDDGRRAVHELHERLGAHVVHVPAQWESLLQNVNTPQDLERLSTH